MRATAPAVLQEAAGAPHRLRLAGVLREGRDLGPVVGRGRLNAQHRADEALADAAVLHRRAPVLGGAHERPVCEAAAREELGHVKPIKAAPEESPLRVLGQALELLDGRRQRVDRVGKSVAALLDPLLNRDLYAPGASVVSCGRRI